LCIQDIKRLLYEDNGLQNAGGGKLDHLVRLYLRGDPVPDK
jgi:hypothetical protein